MNQREHEVRRCATELLDELGVDVPPVDPVWIARQEGLSVEEKQLSTGVFGALWKRGDSFGIIVSQSCPTIGHRRFSLAHELGHYHVDGHVDAMFVGGSEIVESKGGFFRNRRDPLEREADWFASELLVPSAQLGSRIRDVAPSIEVLRCLAGEFQTSLSMIAIRYSEVSDRAVASVLSREGQVEWAACSNRIQEHDWSWGLGKRDLVPRGTATLGLAQDRSALQSGETRTSSGLACEWFGGAPPELELEEDAMGLRSFGRVLTFLLLPDLPDPEELAEHGDDDGPRDWRDAMREYRMD